MNEQNTDRSLRASRQADRMRELYAQIGEPLPEGIVLDLLQHLDRALELAEEDEKPADKHRLNA
ncbi:MAG: hypothetical protein Q4G06_12120 [Clostridia bacterium]|nr:hypothetical protein [Clostridia bacterium]